MESSTFDQFIILPKPFVHICGLLINFIRITNKHLDLYSNQELKARNELVSTTPILFSHHHEKLCKIKSFLRKFIFPYISVQASKINSFSWFMSHGGQF
jgi:hypothetical protein